MNRNIDPHAPAILAAAIRKGIFTLSIVLSALTSALVVGCIAMGPSDEGGTGGEIVGKAEYPDSGVPKRFAIQKAVIATGLPVISGSIFCYPRTFIPDTSWVSAFPVPKAYTDDTGGFHIKDLPHVEVVVEASDNMGNGAVKSQIISKDSVYNIGVLTLQKTGSVTIQGHTVLPGNVRFYVSVKGTRCIARGTQSDVDVTLTGIPSGISHTVNITVYEPIYLSLDIANVTVPAGGNVVLQTFQIQ